MILIICLLRLILNSFLRFEWIGLLVFSGFIRDFIIDNVYYGLDFFIRLDNRLYCFLNSFGFGINFSSRNCFSFILVLTFFITNLLNRKIYNFYYY